MSITVPAHVRAQAIPAALEAIATLTPVLNRYPRTRRTLQVIATARTCYSAFSSIRKRLTPEIKEGTWTVTVSSRDDLYSDALALISSQAEENWQAVEAITSYGDEPVRATPTMRAKRDLVLDGHPISVIVGSATHPKMNKGDDYDGPRNSPTQIVFTAKTEDGQKSVLSALSDVGSRPSRKDTTRRPILFTSGGWGWAKRGLLRNRPVESVAVTDGQVQSIVDEIQTFLELEPEYERRGVPFHRAFLLYGPPGTGKTSAAKAIANSLGRDLFAATLGSVPNDEALFDLIKEVGSNAILLLEDVDSIGAARQRDEDHADDTGEDTGITATGLLNALDGVDTPHGLITILTTNHKEFLDEALLRPGRVDKHVFFGYPDDATVERHFAFFYGEPSSAPLFAAGRSGAEVNEVLVSHMFDPEGAQRLLSQPALEVAA